MIEERPAFTVDPDNPGSDVLGATAAALAATSAVFLPLNREYAGLCLQVRGLHLDPCTSDLPLAAVTELPQKSPSLEGEGDCCLH
jgi:hypothetical protein